MMPRQRQRQRHRHRHRPQNFVLSCSQYLPAKKKIIHVSRTPPNWWLSIKTGCDWLVSSLYLRTKWFQGGRQILFSLRPRCASCACRSAALRPVLRCTPQHSSNRCRRHRPNPDPRGRICLLFSPSRRSTPAVGASPVSLLWASTLVFLVRVHSEDAPWRVFFGQTDCTDGGFLCEIYESALFESGVGWSSPRRSGGRDSSADRGRDCRVRAPEMVREWGEIGLFSCCCKWLIPCGDYYADLIRWRWLC